MLNQDTGYNRPYSQQWSQCDYIHYTLTPLSCLLIAAIQIIFAVQCYNTANVGVYY